MARTPMWRRHLRFWGSDVRADVEAELDYHVRELTERLAGEGRAPAEARAEAQRRFGDYARVRAACVGIDRGWERQRRWRRLLADLWQDLRIGVRTLAKNPGFAVSAVVVLGLGLGAATVMVGVINAVFVRPLPFPEPENLPLREAPGGWIAGSVDWRYLTGDYLRVLRIPLVAGRAFGEADHRVGAPPVALVNEEYVRRVGAGRTVIGTRLQTTAIDFDDHAREIVGVLGDVGTRGVTATRPTVFVPAEQVPDDLLVLLHGFFPVNWALRTRDDATGIRSSVERVIRPGRSAVASVRLEVLATWSERQRFRA